MSEAIYPRPLAAWWMVAVFAIAGFVSYTDRMILGALVDPLRADLGITDAQVSLLQGAAFSLVYVIAGLFMGRLADCRRRLTVIALGATVWSLGTIACALAPGFWSLFGARMVVGVGEAALAPAAVSLIADSFPPHRRGSAISLFVMGTIVGGPAAITIGGLLLGGAEAGAFDGWGLSGTAPWRVALLGAGALGLMVPALCLTLREPARRGASGEAQTWRHDARRLIAAAGVLIPLYLGMAFLCVGDYGLLSWMPTHLGRRFGLTAGEIGVTFGLITTAAGLLGAAAGGVLSDQAEVRGGARARLQLAALCAAIGLGGALLIGLDDVSASFTALAIWTFASSVAGITGIAAVQALVTNESRGLAMALVSFFNTLLGLGAGPTLVAVATEKVFLDPTAVGDAIVLVVTPAAALATLLFLWAARAGSASSQ